MLPPALPLKQQSHQCRIPAITIIGVPYRCSIHIVVWSYCCQCIFIVMMWALLHCCLAADATIKSSSTITESASYHGRIVVIMIWSANAMIKSLLPCRHHVIVLLLSTYRHCHDLKPAYPCHLATDTDATIKSSSPHLHSSQIY